MVIMSMESYENAVRQFSVYKDVRRSEKQIEDGQVKDAKTALRDMRAKYDL